ncbi:hypothetical protein THAOC_13155, partial [Thalassiosira oceanica]
VCLFEKTPSPTCLP